MLPTGRPELPGSHASRRTRRSTAYPCRSRRAGALRARGRQIPRARAGPTRARGQPETAPPHAPTNGRQPEGPPVPVLPAAGHPDGAHRWLSNPARDWRSVMREFLVRASAPTAAGAKQRADPRLYAWCALRLGLYHPSGSLPVTAISGGVLTVAIRPLPGPGPDRRSDRRRPRYRPNSGRARPGRRRRRARRRSAQRGWSSRVDLRSSRPGQVGHQVGKPQSRQDTLYSGNPRASSKLSTPPNPVICLTASLCCGCEASPG